MEKLIIDCYLANSPNIGEIFLEDTTLWTNNIRMSIGDRLSIDYGDYAPRYVVVVY